MTKYVWILLLVVSPVVQAFDFSELQKMADDPEAMQRAAEQMAKEMAEASECANAAGLEKMRTEGAAMHEKIRTLCAGGDRNGAERVAIDYSKKFMDSAEYRQIKKCGEKMMALLPAGYMEQAQAKGAAAGSAGTEVKHVCDAMQP
jgi:hypothetical protein